MITYWETIGFNRIQLSLELLGYFRLSLEKNGKNQSNAV